MKQRKIKVKQKHWEKQIDEIPRCFYCNILLIKDEYIFCNKCSRDLEASGKDLEKMIKEYENERRKK